jgi:hypothetical protein
MPKDDDIKEVRASEERRGKRPIDIEEKRRSLVLRRKIREALHAKNEEQFREMLINDLGQLPGTPVYEHSLKAWKAYHDEE